MIKAFVRHFIACALVVFLTSSVKAAPLFNATVLSTESTIVPQVEGGDDSGRILLHNVDPRPGAPEYLFYDPKAAGSITPISTSRPTLSSDFLPSQISGNGQYIVGMKDGQTVLSSNGNDSSIPGFSSGVNNSGQVAYHSLGSSGDAAILSGGQSTSLGKIPGYEATLATAINNSGQASATVVHLETSGGGSVETSQPAFYNGTQLVALGTLGGSTGNAVGINNQGDLIGSTTDASNLHHGFLSHAGGPLIDLGFIPGFNRTDPQSINDQGQIVGFAGGIPGHVTAFFYQDGTITDLNSLLAPSSIKMTITGAWLITNLGQIVAAGVLEGEQYRRLLLLTPDGLPLPPSPDQLIQVESPVPEPSVLAMFGVISAMLFTHRRRSGR